MGYVKYFFLIYFVFVNMLCLEGGIMKPEDSGHRLTDDWHEDQHKRQGDFKYEGIFVRFLRNALNVLIEDVRGKKLEIYFRHVYRYFRSMDFKYTTRLSKVFKDLSEDDSHDIKQELVQYRKELDKDLQHRTEFFKAINEVFTLQQNVLFDDYVYELRNYGKGDRLLEDLDDETHKILHDVILNNIMKLGYKDRKELEKKLRKAVREYTGYDDDPYGYIKVLESGTFPPRRGEYDCENEQCDVKFSVGVDIGAK